MANIQNRNVNNEDFWIDGYSSLGIKTTEMLDTGSEIYWMDGSPAINLFPSGNHDTGRFFIIFDEG